MGKWATVLRNTQVRSLRVSQLSAHARSHPQTLSESFPSWTAARQAPLSVELSRQEYWGGLPFPSPGDLPNPGLLHCRWILYHLSHKGAESLGLNVGVVL